VSIEPEDELDVAGYRVGYVLVNVINDPSPPRGVDYPDGPPPQLNMIEPATLREYQADAATWINITNRAGKKSQNQAHPPDWCIKANRSLPRGGFSAN
jgi:hypothetical protein